MCPCGEVEMKVREIDRRDDQLRCKCGLEMDRQMSAPVIQTVATHARGFKGKNACDGQGYYDYNLTDRATGKPPYITSLDQKRRLLKEKGLEEVGDDMSLPGAEKRRDDERREGRGTVTFDAPRS
jgi:hypothetical protein